MKTIGLCALLVVLSGGVAQAKEGITLKINSSDDPRTEISPRRDLSDTRLTITSRDGSTLLMLMNDVVGVQLTDRALADVKPDKDSNFFEELVVSGVRLALGKSIEYPISAIKTIEYRDGFLRLTNDQGKPVFTEVKVNGTDVLRDFSSTDAARFINAFRSVKARR